MSWISTFAITKIYIDGSLDTFQWIRCVNLLGFRARWNKTKSCKVHFHLLDSNIFGITECSHCWITIFEYYYVTLSSTFFIDILHLCRIDLWMLPRLSRFLTCHNDVIDAGQNNRLFVPGIVMDRECLRLSHMQIGTYYVQICDSKCYTHQGKEII